MMIAGDAATAMASARVETFSFLLAFPVTVSPQDETSE
jgi:hypothetical protein